jgi:hypothetical protein
MRPCPREDTLFQRVHNELFPGTCYQEELQGIDLQLVRRNTLIQLVIGFARQVRVLDQQLLVALRLGDSRELADHTGNLAAVPLKTDRRFVTVLLTHRCNSYVRATNRFSRVH